MKSEQFDDIYFSREDGLAETRHTFLAGNGLPEAWQGRARFTICETGFGTGLNMLAAWQMFEETAGPEQRLDLISIEKYPLTPAQIRAALSGWDFGGRLERLLALYPLRVRGFHRIDLTPRVTLTLVFDDARIAITDIDACVDAWFLDGFAPAKNPEMWHPDLFSGMAALSAPGATLATFTAAGEVRRGLAGAGFSVEKRKGYGRKRDMVAGRFTGAGRAAPQAAASVAVMGAGIAGLSAAWHLKRAGVNVRVYERADRIGTGASGNAWGIINPKLTAQPSPQSDYYTSAFAYALRVLGMLDSGLARHGAVHLQLDGDKARRFSAYAENLGWHGDHMRLLDAGTASDVAGVMLTHPALFYPDAAVASPARICAALADGLETAFNHTGRAPEADAVIIATAHEAAKFGLQRVRGQTTRLKPNEASARIRTNLCYGGYLTPVMADGMHMCGATFQPWSDDPAPAHADDARNIAQALAAVPALGGGMEVQGQWVGFRAATSDRFPAVGGEGPVLASVGHGSHGMISGLMAGAVLAARLAGAPAPLGKNTLRALDPRRLKAADCKNPQ